MKISGFKNRYVCLGDKVRVYRNLNNGKWSVKALQGEYKGKVVAHVNHCTLQDVKFIISEAGRMRVLRDQRKNVHAFAQGTLHSIDAVSHEKPEYISYDPYQNGFFYRCNDNKKIGVLKKLYFKDTKAFT